MLSRFARLPKLNGLQRILSNQTPAVSSLAFSPAKSFTIKKKSSKIWMNEHINDEYVKKAKMVKRLNDIKLNKVIVQLQK